ncbi:MAG TPA: hypothetical protein VJ867_04345 [Gemmatimonadaceae bacterium]|nr:hypothetical protein [Gemmatimonadaceae bacterium]
MRTILFLALLALPVGASAQRIVIHKERLSHFTLDSSVYVARVSGSGRKRTAEFHAIATFRNITSDTLFLGRCFPDSKAPKFNVFPATADTTVSAYAETWACVGHDQQFAVAPGASRVDTLDIRGPNRWGRNHSPVGVLAGEFRLYYDVRRCRGDGYCPTPPEDSLEFSEPFDVRLP